MAKRPEPQYASTKCVERALAVVVVGGEDYAPNVVGQREQDGAILEEGASVVLEQPVTDLFEDGGS